MSSNLKQHYRYLEHTDSGMIPNHGLRRQMNTFLRKANMLDLAGGDQPPAPLCTLPNEAQMASRKWKFVDEEQCKPGGSIGAREKCQIKCKAGMRPASGQDFLECRPYTHNFDVPEENQPLKCEEVKRPILPPKDPDRPKKYKYKNWNKPPTIPSNLNYGIGEEFGQFSRKFVNHLIDEGNRSSNDKLEFPAEWITYRDDDGKPVPFTQGKRGFNDYFVGVMLRAFENIGLTKFNSESFSAQCPSGGNRDDFPALQPYQLFVKYMITPETERLINRFLVAHGVGSGKTLTMIEVACNYSTDTRPIIFIVPKTLVDNLLQEICIFRSFFRDKLDQWNRDTVVRGAAGDTSALREIETMLKKNWKRLGLNGPLAIFNYSQAGSASESNPAMRFMKKGGHGKIPYNDWKKSHTWKKLYCVTKPTSSSTMQLQKSIPVPAKTCVESKRDAQTRDQQPTMTTGASKN